MKRPGAVTGLFRAVAGLSVDHVVDHRALSWAQLRRLASACSDIFAGLAKAVYRGLYSRRRDIVLDPLGALIELVVVWGRAIFCQFAHCEYPGGLVCFEHT